MKLLALCSFLLLTSPFGGRAAEVTVDYLRDLKPLLKDRCYACHGALQQKSGLRVDTGYALRVGGKGGAAVVIDAWEKSPLWSRITSTNRDERMPPEGEALSAEQVDRFRRWMAAGAPSPQNELPEPDPREHWAFQPPRRPAVPSVTRWPARVSNPVDAFILRELEKQGLDPAPPATREILLRRVTLDLTGVPPTPGEFQAFLGDEAPEAYERVVDRLLASPRYAQRWARHWMDIWRYADWYGRRHVPDVWNSAPQVWHWRDWIVESLQGDKGYDRMLVEMLAADEAAPDDDAARVATGYLVRNWYALNPNQWMRDLVEHTGKAFLGLTFNCAHCHDHKYDPITQRNYFQFRAFFEPLQVRQDWVKGQPDPGPFELYNYSSVRKVANHGIVSVFDERLEAKTYIYERGDERNLPTGKPTVEPVMPAFLGGDALKVAVVEVPAVAHSPGLKDFIQREIQQKSDASVVAAEAGLQAAENDLQAARASLAKLEAVRGAAARIPAEAAVLAAEAGVRRRSDQLTLVRVERDAVRARIAAETARGFSGEASLRDRTAMAAHQAERQWALARSEAAVAAAEDALALLQAEQTLVAARRQAEGTTAVKTELEKVDAAIKKAREQLAATQQGRETNRSAAPSPATQFTPLRPVFPSRSTGRRLALATWLTQRQNPLTARVAVNHIWGRHFHAPLVASVFDFGRNGTRPTHPELLDWLAVEFMEQGWRMKPLHRLLVTSSTYRMASTGASALRGADPENRWLGRMNSGQMESEVVRDSALFVAGDLDFTAGGPPTPNSEAEKSRRRSLYFEYFPEPGGNSAFGEVFDPPSSLECYRRTTTVMPQQALALSNSALAENSSRRVVQQVSPGLEDARFVTAAFERVLARRPTGQELEASLDFLIRTATRDSAEAARVSLVRVLFNHHDFVTIR